MVEKSGKHIILRMYLKVELKFH